MRADFHVHTDISPCGEQSLSEVLKQASRVGLDLVCITDHFTTEALDHLSRLPQNGILVLVGLEYSAPEGDFLLFSPQKMPWLPAGLSAREVLQEIKKVQGLAIWAHPYRWGREPDESLLEEGLVDAIEVLNGRTAPVANAKARELALKYGLPQVAGSDAHYTEELGKVYNCLPGPVSSLEELRANIKNGQVEPLISEDLRPWYDLQLGPRKAF